MRDLDVCGGLISEEETIIPTYHWIPRDMTFWRASRTFLNSRNSFDIYANYAVFLCAQALGVLFGCRSKNTCMCKSCMDVRNHEKYTPSWKRLFILLEEWHENRPSEMRALFTVPAADMKDKDMPFPTVLYGNGSASIDPRFRSFMGSDADFSQYLGINYIIRALYFYCSTNQKTCGWKRRR